MHIYTKEFQSKNILIHEYSSKMKTLASDLMCTFMKPEKVKDVLDKDSIKTYKVKESDILPLEQFNVVRNETKVGCLEDDPALYYEFLQKASKSLQIGLTDLIKNLPIDQEAVITLSGLNPSLHPSTDGISKLKQLPKLFNILTDREIDMFNLEIHKIARINDLPAKKDKDGKNVLPDKWWGQLIENNNMPILTKILKYALSLFTGPLVENLFSEIQNLVSDRKCHMNVDMISARQTIRYVIKNEGAESDLFPIGSNPAPCKKPGAVESVQKAYIVNKDRCTQQKNSEDLMDRVYGVTRYTKKSARDYLEMRTPKKKIKKKMERCAQQ